MFGVRGKIGHLTQGDFLNAAKSEKYLPLAKESKKTYQGVKKKKRHWRGRSREKRCKINQVKVAGFLLLLVPMCSRRGRGGHFKSMRAPLVWIQYVWD